MNPANLLRPPGWLPSSVPQGLVGQWLSVARGWYRQRRAAAEAASARSHHSLIELDARTLRDIGAPHALQARAQGRRQARRDRRDDLRAGGSAGDWQGW
jgi:hypothetical protein